MLSAEAGKKSHRNRATKMESKCSCWSWDQLKYEVKPDWSTPFVKRYFNCLDNRVSKDIALVSWCEISLCMLAQPGTMDSTSSNFANTRWYFALLCELHLNTRCEILPIEACASITHRKVLIVFAPVGFSRCDIFRDIPQRPLPYIWNWKGIDVYIEKKKTLLERNWI